MKNTKHQPGTTGKINKRSKNTTKETKKNEAQEFPGYPPYPPDDDIMNRSSKVVRVEGDLENTNSAGRGLTSNRDQVEGIRTFSRDEMAAGAESEFKQEESGLEEEKDLEAEADDSNVTSEDIQALGPKDLSMDMGEDEQLKQRTWPVDFTGRELDIPGSEQDDAREDIGAEDEENNPYSLGGDRHEDLEEGRP